MNLWRGLLFYLTIFILICIIFFPSSRISMSLSNFLSGLNFFFNDMFYIRDTYSLAKFGILICFFLAVMKLIIYKDKR